MPHQHVNDVDHVNEQIADLSAAEIQISAPIEILLGIPVTPLDRARGISPNPGCRAVSEDFPAPAADARRLPLYHVRIRVILPSLPFIEEFALQLLIAFAGSRLGPHLANAVIHPGSLYYQRPLIHRQRQRFLDVYIPPGLKRSTAMGACQ